MNSKLINIRGTNGSGKSQIIKTLFDRFEYEVWDDAVFIPAWDLVVIGRYFGANGLIPTGGCDQLKIGRVVELIEKHQGHNCIFEGAKESRTYKRWLDYPTADYIFLDTPLKTCLEWRSQRRGERDMPYTDQTLIDGWWEVEKRRKQFIEAGLKVYRISPDNCLSLVFQLLDDIRNEIKDLHRLSGSGKRTGTTRYNGIYSSMPMYPDIKAVRDTSKRFDDFGIQELFGSVLDVGANVGALSFTAANRGAENVLGLEHSWERVVFANRLARIHKYPCRFTQVDFNEFRPALQADSVFCCSVDEYIDNRPAFYSWLRDCTKGTLYFESNIQKGSSVEDVAAELAVAGFSSVKYMGSGDSGGISRTRRTFVCK